MHRVTWVLQIVLGIYFIAIGVLHFIVPEGLPDPMAWMYDLPTGLHYASGAAEILGGLGLILPGLTRIRPELTPLAAAGLAVVMVLAAFWHLSRGEFVNIGSNLVTASVLAFVAYVRWRKIPLGASSASTPAAA
jgi:putative oxidoreductase